jgi:hypothetical protein
VRKTIAELREVIGKYADEHKLRIVLPANQVVYQVKGLDITDAILKAMNIERPAREEARPLTPAVTPAAPPSKDKEPATGAK